MLLKVSLMWDCFVFSTLYYRSFIQLSYPIKVKHPKTNPKEELKAYVWFTADFAQLLESEWAP